MARLELLHPSAILRHYNEMVRGPRAITAATALRLSRYFGTDARSWTSLQTRYELEAVARTQRSALQAIRPPRRGPKRRRGTL